MAGAPPDHRGPSSQGAVPTNDVHSSGAEMSALDRMLEPIRRLVSSLKPVTDVDYRGQFRATVNAQNGAVLDLTPLDKKQWGQGIKATVVWGMPGATVQFSPGDTVLFSFADGSPANPIVLGFYHALPTLDSTHPWTFDASDALSPSPLARKGDTVDSGFSIVSTVAAGTGAVTFNYTSPDGVLSTVVMTFASGLITTVLPTNLPNLPDVGNCIGVINRGAANVKA